MVRLVECVPNFSEGRDRAVLDRIAGSIREVEGVRLLDMDPGADTNRTVVTFVGTPEGVKEAAFRAIRTAAELIDMRKHRGEHARQGATDVCPFIPISGVTMEDCVALSAEVAERVGRELGIPVYLYEFAATRPERRNLADIRKGEYEALKEKLTRAEWKPDFGPAKFNERSGATVIGAREFLVAYNVNLNTRDARLAKEIAFRIREQGSAKRDAEGKIVKDSSGATVFESGRFKAVKATGWYIEQYGQAQVTINLVDCKVSPPHLVYEAIKQEAESMGVSVTGSEIVGLIPRETLLNAGRFYMERQGKSAGVPERELVHIAAKSLKLDDVSPFDPGKKIIEYAYADDTGKLVSMDLRAFVDELSGASPAPGGGSVAALAAAQAAGLVAMVSNLTHGKKGYEAVWGEMARVGAAAQALKDEALAAVDEDTAAFNAVMACMKMPRKTEEERKERDSAVEEANRLAAMVPLGVLRRIPDVLELALAVAERGNVNSLSDAGVAAAMCRCAAQGAAMNVLINLKSLSDEAAAAELRREAEGLLGRVVADADRLIERIFKQLLCPLTSLHL